MPPADTLFFRAGRGDFDHGTGFDIAGKNSDERSLLEAIRSAIELAPMK